MSCSLCVRTAICKFKMNYQLLRVVCWKASDGTSKGLTIWVGRWLSWTDLFLEFWKLSTRLKWNLMSQGMSIQDGRDYGILGHEARIWNNENWGMIKLINFFSRKTVMENFLRLVGVRIAGGTPWGWPQMIRAVID